MTIPPARNPDSSAITTKSGDGKAWEDCWIIKERSEERNKEVREEIRRLTGDNAPRGMCQKYRILQPQHRKVTIYLCNYYEANKKLGKLKKALIGTGIVTGVICIAGSAIVTASALGVVAAGKLLTAAGVMAMAGGGTSGVTLGVAAYLPTGEGIKDYNRGNPIDSIEVSKSDKWQDTGTTYEEALGQPFPCVE